MFSTLRLVVDTLFHEGSEGRDAGAGSNHDDVNVTVFWKEETLGRGHEDVDRCAAGVDFIGHVERAQDRLACVRGTRNERCPR